MSLDWIHESPARWDRNKAIVVGRAERGTLPDLEHSEGDLVPGEWWRVEDNGETLGYGWMDCTWGDAEILLAVAPTCRRRGVGAWILDRLEEEAAARGVNYLFNEVRASHPDPKTLTRWLLARGFERSHDDRLFRRRVRRPAP